MTYTNIPAGTTQWDVPVNAAFTDQDARITANLASTNASISTLSGRVNVTEARENISANEMGMVGWNYDPAMGLNNSVATLGQLTMCRVEVRVTATASSLVTAIVGTGTALTAGQNFAGLYNPAGTLIAQTVDQTAAWGTTGTKVMNVVTPISLAPGMYYWAILVNATTSPTFVRGVTSGTVTQLINLNQSNATLRFATFGTGLTALPASIDMTTRVGAGTGFWAGIN